MYAHRSRRTKTDKRDARTLMDACCDHGVRVHDLFRVQGL